MSIGLMWLIIRFIVRGLTDPRFVQEVRKFLTYLRCGFGGLELARWPLVPKFTGSNQAEVVGFFRAKKSSARLPSEEK